MSTVSKMAVKDIPLNPVAQAQTEAAEDKHPPGGTEVGTAAAPKKIFVSLRTGRPPKTLNARKASWKQTSTGQRQPAGFFPRLASCRWLRTCISLSS